MEELRIDCITEYKKIINRIKRKNFLKDTFLNDSADKFKITKHRDGKYPAIVTISGFTSEDKDNRKNWEHSILTLFPESEWFHLEWDSKKLPFDEEKIGTMPAFYEEKKKEHNSFKIFLNVIANRFTYGTHLVINNFWHVSVRNAKVAGSQLGEVLSACPHKEFILVGHSLGARIIYNCLDYLHNNNVITNINEVHMLGGAVGNNSARWKNVSEKVVNKIYNYYSNNDMVLKTSYRIAMLSRNPIGLTKIDHEKVINKDSSLVVAGHSMHIEKFYWSRFYKTAEDRKNNNKSKKNLADAKKANREDMKNE